MWFLVGLVALAVGFWLSYTLRRDGAFSGDAKRHHSESGDVLRYEYQSGKYKTCAWQQVGVAANPQLEFHVRLEGFISRALATLGIGHEIEVGNADLDRHFLIECDDMRLVRWIKTQRSFENLLIELKHQGLTRLVAYQGKLWLETQYDKAEQELREAQAPDIAFSLQKFRALLPDLQGPLERNTRARAGAAFVAAVSSASFFTSIFLWIGWNARSFPKAFSHLSLSVGGAFLGVLALLFVAWTFAKHMGDSTRTRAVLAELLTIGLVGFASCAVWASFELNVSLATQPVRSEQVEVSQLEIKTKRGRRGSKTVRYHMHLQGFSGYFATAKFKIDKRLYDQLSPQMRVLAKWQVGAFGVPILLEEPKPVIHSSAAVAPKN